MDTEGVWCWPQALHLAGGQLTCLWHVTWPQLSNAPPHTHLLAPKSTSAKLATWRCQPLIHLPPEARAMAVPDSVQLSPHFSLRPQNPTSLWPPPSTGGSLALVTLPLSHHRDCSLSHQPGPTCNPTLLDGVQARKAADLSRPATLGSKPARLVALAPDCAHSTHPVHCAQGWPGTWDVRAVVPSPFQEASVDWTHPSTGLGHPTPPPAPPHPAPP